MTASAHPVTARPDTKPATLPRVMMGMRRVARQRAGVLFPGPDPLADTICYVGDPGLCGPNSVSWRVIGDVSAFVGGIRALLIQACHPEVIAGFLAHSRFRDDPLGRLGRTSAYVTATTFGAIPEVHAAVAAVQAAHRSVIGTSPRGRSYRADDAALAAWVHNTLTDSFLVAYDYFGPRPRLTAAEEDRFVVEQAQIARLLGVVDVPDTARELRHWVRNHPDIGPSDELGIAVDFLDRPPLPMGARPIYQQLYRGAGTLIGVTQRTWLGLPTDLRRADHDFRRTRRLVAGLRFVLGAEGPSAEAARRRAAGITTAPG